MKKVLIIVISIVVVIVGIIAGLYINNKNEITKLDNKSKEIIVLLEKEEPDLNKIKENASKTVTKSSYLEVEKSYNEYVLDLVNKLDEFENSIDENKISNLLGIDNIKKDGKEFKETTKVLTEAKDNIKKYKEEFNELFSDKKIMSYIDNKKISDSKKKYYKDELIGKINKKEIKELNNSMDEAEKIITKIEKLINFLKENSNKWEVQDKDIAFATQELIDKYNSLVKDIKS